jgi:tetratricopeptide (TPR) repeat protein
MTEPNSIAVESLLLRYNKVAMDYLRDDAFIDCAKFLKKADKLLGSDNPSINKLPNRQKLLGLTYNNFACYHKRRRQPNVALTYLKRALEAEAVLETEVTNLAGTHLNICAIYSELAKHQEALESAQTALGLLNAVALSEAEGAGISTLTTTAIAYYNCGVELEHLNKLQEAAAVFSSGFSFAQEYLGEEHYLTKHLETSFKAASQRTQAVAEMRSLRRHQRERAKIMFDGRLTRVNLPTLKSPTQRRGRVLGSRTRPDSSMNPNVLGEHLHNFTSKGRRLHNFSPKDGKPVLGYTLPSTRRFFTRAAADLS